MSDRSERKRRDLANGDRWRLELECVAPGESFLVVHVDGKQEGRLPIANVLQIHARFDPEFADAREREVARHRQLAGDWESKYYDQVANEATIKQLQDSVHEAKRRQAAAESKLKLMAQVVRTLLANCYRCEGAGQVEGLPCPKCMVAREVFANLVPSTIGGASIYIYEDGNRSNVGGVVARDGINHDDTGLVERGDAALREAVRERDHLPVFLLHPGVGTPAYWEFVIDRDPVVQALRRGEIKASPLEGPFPCGWAMGRYLACSPGMHWVEVTESVVVDRDEGLARVPPWLREKYREIARKEDWK